MAGIISQGAQPPPSGAPGLYVQILPPPPSVNGVPTNVGGLLGSATWGPTNTPMLCGSPADVTRFFGPTAANPAIPGIPPATTDAVANPFDLTSAAQLAFAQANPNGGLALWCVRSVDGLDVVLTSTPLGHVPVTGAFPAAYQMDNVIDDTHNTLASTTSARFAYLALLDTSTGAGGWLYGICYGTLGNGIKAVFAAGAVSGVTVTLSPPGGCGLSTEVYSGLPNTGGFWVALQNALANGIAGVCGPSQLCRLILPSQTISGSSYTVGTNSAVAPVLIASTALAGGIDGTATLGNYTTAESLAGQIMGTSATYPNTGLYTLSGLNPPVAACTVAGFGDDVYGDYAQVATIMPIADAMAAQFCTGLALARDTNTSGAVTDVGTIASTDWELVIGKDHVYFNDGVHGSRLMPCSPALVGAICALPPQADPLNTTVKGVQGTYRTSSAGKPSPYSNGEIGLCQNNGILLITQPIPGGNTLGFGTGVNASISVNPITGAVQYASLTNFLAKSLAAAFGVWIGKNQGPNDPDPTRQGVFSALTNFLQNQLAAARIAAFTVQCDKNNNPGASVALHYMYAACSATYYASVWWFILSFTGGSNVGIQISPGSQN